jgi:hypothetical protein
VTSPGTSPQLGPRASQGCVLVNPMYTKLRELDAPPFASLCQRYLTPTSVAEALSGSATARPTFTSGSIAGIARGPPEFTRRRTLWTVWMGGRQRPINARNVHQPY